MISCEKEGREERTRRKPKDPELNLSFVIH